MDNLQHIDNLLRRAAQEPANALVTDSDWAVIEKKLKYRKNRIYAMWFFLALISITSTVGYLWNSINPTQTQIVQTVDDTQSHELLATEQTQQNLDPTAELTNKTDGYRGNINRQKTTKVESYNTSKPVKDIQGVNYPIKEIKNAPIANNHWQSPLKTLKSIDLSKSGYDYTAFTDGSLRSKTIVIKIPALDDNTKGSTHKPYFEVGFAFTPSLSDKITAENKTLSGLINRNYAKLVGDNETISFSNSFGVNIQYHLSDKLYFSSGLFMAQRAEYINYDYLITESPIETNNKINEYFPLDPLDYIKVQYKGSNSYHFLEIPVNIGHKQAISRNFEIRSQVGISYLHLLSQQGKKGNFYDLELNDLKTLDFNKNNIATNIKSGLYYSTARLAIGLEPVFGINLNSLTDTKTQAIKTKPYSYGLNLSTNFKLIKK